MVGGVAMSETGHDHPRTKLIYERSHLVGGRCELCDLVIRFERAEGRPAIYLRSMLKAAFAIHPCIEIEMWPPQAGDVWITKDDEGVRLWSIVESDLSESLRALLARGVDAGNNDRDSIQLAQLNPRLVYRYTP